MKLSDFNELCRQEWMQEDRGDVIALNLTDISWMELAADAIAEEPPESWAPIHRPAGANELVNPVTRSVVTIENGAASDTAMVSLGRQAPSRTVTLT